MDIETLFHLYNRQIYTLCMRLANNKDLAEDVFGETWLKIAEKHKNLKEDKPPLNWMYSVCINCYKKQRIKESKTAVFQSRDEQNDILKTIPGTTDLEAEYTAREEAASLNTALQSLKEIYRIPLILFYFRDLSYEDIGRIMKIPMGRVKFRIHQAKELLRNKLRRQKYHEL